MCDKPEISVWESFTWGDGVSGARMAQPSIQDALKDTEIQVFPNPSADSIHLKTGLKNYRIEIYDGNGRLVVSKENVKDSDAINTKELQAGTYMITAQGKDNYKKLLIK